MPLSLGKRTCRTTFQYDEQRYDLAIESAFRGNSGKSGWVLRYVCRHTEVNVHVRYADRGTVPTATRDTERKRIA